MKIYFAGSIRGGRDDVDLYIGIINYLKQYGDVLSEHIGDKNLKILGEDGKTDRYIHDRDLSWVKEADVVVAEVTKASLGVGYEIRYGIDNEKGVLCLYRPQEDKMLSAMISGSPDVINVEYNNLDEAKKVIDDFLEPYL
jgi:nucleoside 2-deoxyribosyltransferase|tara:strand:- start:281 stop:700 length:420 start_codon:yes stop_codon:yes gene_type:complete